MKGGYPVLFSPRHPEELWIPRGAEIEIVLLKERPNFKPEKFIDNCFLQGGAEGAESGRKNK
jgi:hypothetical protein